MLGTNHAGQGHKYRLLAGSSEGHGDGRIEAGTTKRGTQRRHDDQAPSYKCQGGIELSAACHIGNMLGGLCIINVRDRQGIFIDLGMGGEENDDNI